MTPFLLGPVYQPPAGLLTSSVVNARNSDLAAKLNQVLQSGHSDFGDFEASTSSISITIVSTEHDEDAPFFDFHYSSPSLNHSAGGTDRVTKNSIYRIGSISKLITTYVLLVGYGWESWDHAVTRYVPELREAASSDYRRPIEDVYWDKVTIGALTSHLSGVGRDYANADLASQNFPWMEAGLPELSPHDIPHCAGNASLPPCNRQEYFQGVIQRHPVFSPWTTPVYSNLGFRILGYVLEALGNAPYSSLIQTKVLEPLGLTDTFATYPLNKGFWVIPAGNENDFVLIMVMRHHLYTKSGSVGQYSSQLMLLPDYGVALSVLVAGSSNGRVVTIATEMLLQSLIPVLENIALGEECANFCGTYESSQPNVNSSITIAADAAGLYLDRWINQGVDIKAVAQAYAAQTGSSPFNFARLQATNLRDPSVANHTAQGNRRVAYRLIFDTTSEDPNGPPRILDLNSHQWSATDSIMYGEIGVDDFVVHLDANGTAMMIEPRVVRDTLRRSG
ncbi:hypothetical protein E0Z10_g3004 [Xylaria hypoxylon]|uniref:Uncharacterized protein n=1 Tax=Xylaria hypoxylon TaxID=37992 RepID=A0A4Z0Z8P9_9PEZI|nr:hypothetical protein E0Z10_g3004 [Xylaria hypoxylon]